MKFVNFQLNSQLNLIHSRKWIDFDEQIVGTWKLASSENCPNFIEWFGIEKKKSNYGYYNDLTQAKLNENLVFKMNYNNIVGIPKLFPHMSEKTVRENRHIKTTDDRSLKLTIDRYIDMGKLNVTMELKVNEGKHVCTCKLVYDRVYY